MARSLDDALESVRKLRERPLADAAFVEELRGHVASRFSLAVGKAARLAAEREVVSALEGDLVAAFERFAGNGGETDKGCHAKREIAEALQTARAFAAPLFLRGVRLRQPEKGYGGPVDTAVDVRAACAMGLVRMHHPAAMDELAELLADPEPGARRAAARAIGYAEDRRGGPLLRFKALSGDEDPAVVAECVSGLLAMAPESAIPFAARLLDSTRDGALAESVALALGESRRAEALEPLRAFYAASARRGAELRTSALAAIALLRLDAAYDFLFETIADGGAAAAADALRALVPFRADAQLSARARAAAASRSDGGQSLAPELERFAP